MHHVLGQTVKAAGYQGRKRSVLLGWSEKLMKVVDLAGLEDGGTKECGRGKGGWGEGGARLWQELSRREVTALLYSGSEVGLWGQGRGHWELEGKGRDWVDCTRLYFLGPRSQAKCLDLVLAGLKDY